MPGMVDFWNEGAAALLQKTLVDRQIRAEDLAERLHVDPRTVRNWKRTKSPPSAPSLANLHDLCTSLEVTPDFFRQAARSYIDAAAVTEAASEPSAMEATGVDQNPEPWTRLRRSLRLRVGVLALIAVTGVTVLWWALARSSAVRTAAIPPEKPGVYDRALPGDVSPDGKWVVFPARSLPSEARLLFLYSIKDRKTRPLPATEGNYTSFFWSTDSRSIFFVSATDLMKVSVTGVAPERIVDVGEALKGSANQDGVIILGSRKGLMRVSAVGKAEPLTRLGPNEVAHSLPSFLPSGDRVLFTITKKVPDETLSRFAAVASIRTGAIHLIGPLSSRAQYVHGDLLYVREQVLFARPFDVKTLRFSGDERPLASPVWTDRQTGEAAFSASASALLVMPPEEIPPLYHVSADGRIRRKVTDLSGIQYVAVANTSDEIAVAARHPERDHVSLWLCPLDGRSRVRLISQEVRPSSPIFSPDDRVLYYADAAASWANIHAVDLRPGGSPPRAILQLPDQVAPRDVSPDGRFLLFQRWHNRDGNAWYMPIDEPAKAKPLIATPEEEGDARFSPDGRRVSFVAERGSESGVFVSKFPPTSQVGALVARDGWKARWSLDGRRIYFARDKSIMEADLATGATRKLFDMARPVAILEVARDGGFFVREMPLDRPQTLVTPWRTLAKHPLNLVKKP